MPAGRTAEPSAAVWTRSQQTMIQGVVILSVQQFLIYKSLYKNVHILRSPLDNCTKEKEENLSSVKKVMSYVNAIP
jgi:hypothetical protein